MIITLCGSARFEHEFHDWNKRLSLRGHVVIGLSRYPSQEGSKDWYTPEQKVTLDLVHLRKINVADAVLVINVDGYVGDSTRREIEWARMCGKDVYFMDEPDEDYWPHGLESNDASELDVPAIR